VSQQGGLDPEVYAKAAEQRALDLDDLGRALAETLGRHLGVADV